MPDESPRSPDRRILATIPYAAIQRGQVTPDMAVELARRIAGQPVKAFGRKLGTILDAGAELDGLHATIELERGVTLEEAFDGPRSIDLDRRR